MVVKRGEVWIANLPEPTGSGPGLRRPVLIVQSDDFNASAIPTTIVAIITSNVRLGDAPGNVPLSKRQSKLKHASVIDVSQLFTIDKTVLSERVSRLPEDLLHRLTDGIKLVLALK